MNLLKVGDKIKLPCGQQNYEEYEILEVQIYKNSVSYGVNYKRDGDLWLVFAGILKGDKVVPLSGSWV